MMAEWRRSSRVNFTSMLSMRGLANHLIWYSEFDQVSESVFCANKLIYFNIALLGNDSASSLCLQSQICGLKLHKHMSWLQFMTQSKSGLMCFFSPHVFQLQCSAQVTGGAVELTVSGLKAEHTDMYRCKIEVFYPPPYLSLTGNGTLIHVLGETPTHDIRMLRCMSTHWAHSSLTFCPSFPLSTGNTDCPMQGARRQTAPQDDEEQDEEDKEKMATFSVPVGALMIMIIIVLIIIISFQVRALSYFFIYVINKITL